MKIKHVSTCQNSFAALSDDGAVVSWGHQCDEYRGVVNCLRSDIESISATKLAFAALSQTGAVTTWGSAFYGGNSTHIGPLLASGVRKIVATQAAFAALKNDGSVVVWGQDAFGSNPERVAEQLEHVTDLYATELFFVAKRQDGSSLAWGNYLMESLYDDIEASSKKSPIIEMYHAGDAFGRLHENGDLIFTNLEEEVTYESAQVGKVRKLIAIDEGINRNPAMIVIFESGNIEITGKDLPAELDKIPTESLKNLIITRPQDPIFIALTTTGTLHIWTTSKKKAPHEKVLKAVSQSNIKEVYATQRAITAITNEGTIMCWGDPKSGGQVPDTLKNNDPVVHVTANSCAFAALTQSGRLIAWGGWFCDAEGYEEALTFFNSGNQDAITASADALYESAIHCFNAEQYAEAKQSCDQALTLLAQESEEISIQKIELMKIQLAIMQLTLKPTEDTTALAEKANNVLDAIIRFQGGPEGDKLYMYHVCDYPVVAARTAWFFNEQRNDKATGLNYLKRALTYEEAALGTNSPTYLELKKVIEELTKN